ncbi:hypothetical protein WMY93_006016 [Mugilogobius chulae]|uniref:Axin-1 n=1 Tax=Mugilogobius chulae TaxID=88201 RepID=A0AAW0PUV2_9GOBI
MGDTSTYTSSSSSATPRRPDLDLGYEPEGSASPTPPYLKWAESLHSLLDDQEGIQLFRNFLCQEGCADLLDFWFACSGFRQTSQEKRAKLAKAIYRKYIIDGSGIVSRQIKPATKSFIRDCVGKPHPDPAMFEQAQTEIQAMMEENTYPLFLKSDLYLEYTRTGGESPKPNPNDQSPTSGPASTVPGYLPTLAENEEWRCAGARDPEDDRDTECSDTPANRLTHSLLMHTVPQRTAVNRRRGDSRDTGKPTERERTEIKMACRSPCQLVLRPLSPLRPWREPVNPYYANLGYARAPPPAPTTASSRACPRRDPAVQVPKAASKEMHESAKANGRVPLPHIPRMYRIPKDIHVEPERFAAALISKLETVLREREAQERLEERLKRVRLEEEGDDADSSMTTSMSSHSIPLSLPPSFALYGARYSETTPACAPTYGGWWLWRTLTRTTRSPSWTSTCSGSASQTGVSHRGRDAQEEAGSRSQANFLWNGESGRSRNYADGAGAGNADGLGYSSKGSTLSRRGGKKADAAAKTEESARAADAPVPLEDMERNQKILQWMMEGEALRHKKSSHGGSTSGSRRTGTSSESPRPHLGGASRGRSPLGYRAAPEQPLLVACRPVCRQPGPAFAPLHPGPRHAPEPRPQPPHPAGRGPQETGGGETQSSRTAGQAEAQVCEACGALRQHDRGLLLLRRAHPYRTSVKGRVVTLGQFKELLTKKGHYRFYFKKVSDEFDCGVVFEEVRDDDAILPIFEEKIIGKVEKVD